MTHQDCIFCRIVAREIPSAIIEEDEETLAFMDIAPATRGHALVIPKRHADDLWEIEPDQLAAVSATAQRVALRARDRLHAEGVNLINSCRAQAWQTVFHFHMHVIPRYDGDPLRLPWQPLPGDFDEIAAVAALLRHQA
jgi:histidine triad (HIT) family protein